VAQLGKTLAEARITLIYGRDDQKVDGRVAEANLEARRFTASLPNVRTGAGLLIRL
jgi:hypothetical protein